MFKNNCLILLFTIFLAGVPGLTKAQNGSSEKRSGVNIIITQSPKIIVTVEGIAHNNCSEDSRGAIDISAEGGYPPYEYFWSHGASTQDVAGLKAGEYKVAVYDNFSCSDTVTVIIREPAPLKARVVSTNDILCYGYDQGEIDIEVEGGTAPYIYNWSNGAITQDVKGLTSGHYSVLVTDANHCQEIVTADIVEKPLIIRSVDDVENIRCFGDGKGEVDISVSGGVPPYQYFWSNGETTEDLSSVEAGVYEVIVQDSQGCTEVYSAKVVEPDQLTVKFDNVLDIRCSGNNGGAINIGVEGGVQPYTYRWSNGKTTQDIVGVNAGKYSVTVIDANGCFARLDTVINQPSKLKVKLVSSKDVSYHGGRDGAIDIEPSGGVPPYKFKWSNGKQTQDLNELAIGNYSARVSDGAGCSTIINVTIDQPPPLIVQIDKVVNVNCHGNNSGEISLTAQGGVTPYSYLWSNGSTNEDIRGLTAGQYSVSITDANGHKQTLDTILQQPQAFVAKVNKVKNINCHGVSEGAVDVQVEGGAQPYEYHWSNGMKSQDINDVSAGFYSVKILDGNRCEQYLEVSISEPTPLVAGIEQVRHVSCYGEESGAVSISVKGGVKPYSYSWSNGSGSEDLTALSAGNYAVVITDAKGCSQALEAKVEEPAELLVREDRIKHIDCHSNNSGQVSLLVTGGIQPYTYQWNTGQTTRNLNEVEAGDYSVLITDNNGCSVSYSTILTQPPKMQLALKEVVDNLCYGDHNGEINIEVGGGTAPYVYRWSNGETSQDIHHLVSGQYEVKVRDANRCFGSLTATIKENPLLTAKVEVKNINCNGESTGAIDLTVEGGKSPYTFQWNNQAVTEDISGLKAGHYSVIVQDATGCAKQVRATIMEPSRFVAMLESEVHVKCYGEQTGSINIKTAGGSPPYTYNWNNGETSKDLKDIPAGDYSLVVSDSKGCSETIQTAITQPTRVSYEIKSVTNLTCYNDSSGAIDISITGGIGPYLYQWSNGAKTQDLVGVEAGTYTVAISEANGCSKTLEATITEPPLLEVEIDEVSHISCSGDSEGAINLTTTGGVPPYQYSWSHGSNEEDAIGLVAGKYSVTVTDSKGCTRIANTEVYEPLPFLARVSSSAQILCYGEKTGRVTVEVTGGVMPYDFLWNSGDTTQNLSGKAAGVYTVNITDKNSCKQTLTVNIAQPDKLTPTLVSSGNVSCFNGSDGSINVSVIGGKTPYTYLWSNSSSLQDQNNLPAGTYFLEITDANGCKDSTIEVTIGQPEQLVAELDNVTHINTYGMSTGNIGMSVSGGSLPYAFSWSNGAMTQSIKNIPAGNYSVRITDAKGCEEVIDTVVNQPPPLEVRPVSVTNILCSQDLTGAITVKVSGGVEPYIFNWSNGAKTQNISNIGAGDYSLTVTDDKGHQKTFNTKVSEPTPMNINVDHITHISCYGDKSGAVSLSVSGGVGPYQYKWSNGNTYKDLRGVQAGTYNFQVTDDNGCVSSTEIRINQPSELSARILRTMDISCHGETNGKIEIEVSGGSPPYRYNWSNGARTSFLSEASAGNYKVKITDDNGCFRELAAIISEPPPLVAHIASVKNNQCNGESSGAINLNVNGGSGSYRYIWSHGDTTRNASGLVAGHYEVMVRDLLGCEQKLSATISEPDQLVARTKNVTHVHCHGQNTGTVETIVEGGSKPYKFSWNNGHTGQSLTAAVAGAYTLKVIDAKGCETSLNAEINEPPPLALELHKVRHNLCASDEKGLVDITVSGGVTPYTYLWSNGANSEDLVDVVADSYTVKVKDANGCYNSLTVRIEEPEILTAKVESVSSLSCYGDQDGFINLKVSGGTEPYHYLWNTGATTSSLENVPGGEYRARITDKNGCTTNITTVVKQPTALIKTIDAITDIRCNEDSTGAIYITTLEGTPPYRFEWSNGETTEDITGLQAGTYTLRITESNGCVSALEATIEQPPSFVAQLENVEGVKCFGDETGVVDISVYGGIEPYTYVWSNGAETEDLSNVLADNYSVMVTDANGCLKTINTQVEQPDKLALRIDSVTNVKCCGDSSGAIYITVTGGTEPYQYLWSNGVVTQDIENLTLGQYTVNVTDKNGCTISTLDEDELNLYEQIITKGKFTTRDILFDVAKATIKPESFRTINKIATLMKEHPDLTFRIDGHTDWDGTDAYNQRLSENRANAIRTALIKFGIGKTRLYTKGWGEMQPIATNMTKEGKSLNRRVEFISLTGTYAGTLVQNNIQGQQK